MKKLVVSLVAVVSALIMCFALAGCSSDVSGKTYVYDSIDISWDKDVPDEIKDLFDSEDMAGEYAKLEYTFETDGTLKVNGASSGNWKQEGSKVFIGSEEMLKDTSKLEEAGQYLTAKGNKLTMEESEDGVGTITITFKVK